jgi:hypothetical protein
MNMRAAVRSVDAAARTVDLIISTGAKVLREGWDGPFWEELSLEKKHVRMKRLNNGAPLLDSHGTSWSGPVLADQFGVVESARIEGSGDQALMVGTVRFARAEDDPKADQAFRKVADGIIRNVSVGYRTYRIEKVEGGAGTVPTYRATDWEPYEVSLVPMGADDGAKVRGEELQRNACVIAVATRTGAQVPPKPPTTPQPVPPPSPAKQPQKETLMEDDARSEFVDENPTPPAGEVPPSTEPNERDLGANQERERVQGIILACRAARLPGSYGDKLIADPKMTLVRAQSAIFTELAKRDVDVPRGGARLEVEVGDGPLVHARKGIENALLHRVSPPSHDGKTGFKLEEIGRPYRGMTLLRIAEAFLNQANIRTTGYSKMELAAVALGLTTRGGMHTTSDFANLLADVAFKSLRRAYDEAPQTFTMIGRQVTLPDFKNSNRVQIGDAPALLQVNEHAEFQRGTILDAKEVYKLLTYGRIFAITRQALINDDTSAFDRVATLFGRSARNLESDLVWAQITSNPVMADGNALFSVAHKNLDAVPSVISVASLGKARAAMRIQTSLDGVTLLNVNPKSILLPAALETLAGQFLTQITPALPSSVNPFAGLLAPVVEPRLDVNSVTAWYLAASVDQIDVIEYAYLEGESGPTIESRIGFDIDGLEIKARHDFAAKVLDWRGLYKNPGV